MNFIQSYNSITLIGSRYFYAISVGFSIQIQFVIAFWIYLPFAPLSYLIG